MRAATLQPRVAAPAFCRARVSSVVVRIDSAGGPVAHAVDIARTIRRLGGRVVARTTVTAENSGDSLEAALESLRPSEWSIEGTMGPSFDAFVSRHGRIAERVGATLLLSYTE